MKEKSDIVQMAREAKMNAYNPYSEYAVGAAVRTVDGTVYTGCNIENITFDMCSHAERTAIRTAIADGHRDFTELAISTEDESGAPPCGTCRQFLAEFCADELLIYSDNGESESPSEYTLGEIFPHAFRPENIAEDMES